MSIAKGAYTSRRHDYDRHTNRVLMLASVLRKLELTTVFVTWDNKTIAHNFLDSYMALEFIYNHFLPHNCKDVPNGMSYLFEKPYSSQTPPAQAISPDKSVVNLVVNAVLATSAALARVISPDKLAETSKVNEFAFVLRVFTTVVNATKSPETSLINTALTASAAVAQVR